MKVSGVPSDDALNALRRGVSIPLGDPESSQGIEATKRASVPRLRKSNYSVRAKIHGMKSPSPKAAIASCEKCLKKLVTTSKKFGASNTGHWC